MNIELNRRQVLLHGSSALGLLMLAGCARSGGTKAAAGDMPGPMWPTTNAKTMTPIGAPKTSPYSVPAGPSVPAESVYSGIIARSAWTRSGVARPRDINPMGRVTRITIHHDGMNAFTSTSQIDAAHRLESIRVGHVGRGWADIGYHFVIDPAGRVWAARSTAYQGAHVSDNNENNLGIMCMGNFMLQSPTSATLQTLNRFAASQMRLYNVPISRVYTHRELDKTACPGTNMQRECVRMRAPSGALRLALADIGAGELALA